MYEYAVALSDMVFVPSHENSLIVPRLVDEALKVQGQFFLIEIPN
jgi:hypothetical protein